MNKIELMQTVNNEIVKIYNKTLIYLKEHNKAY
jgi:hypothetical protein